MSYLRLVGAGRFERPTPRAQGRCATRLRYAPTMYCSPHSKLLAYRISNSNTHSQPQNVSKLHQNSSHCTLTVSKPFASLACRLMFSKASRFICSFICEYFLKTFASPCRSNWVTHSSTTPPALSRVAYVERRS